MNGDDGIMESDNVALLGAADANGLSWDWVKPTHEHDADLTKFYAAVVLISLVIVAIFFVNIIYKNRRKPAKRKTRVASKIQKFNMYSSKAAGV